MLELIYTSARSGLRSGSSGFTFVAWTKGIPPIYVNPLEDLSGYKPVWLPGDPHSSSNPVSFSYQKVKYGNLEFSVMSRIGYAGLDYSGRSNKIAHHIIAEEAELFNSSFGPVGCFLQKNNFISSWNSEPQLLNERHLKSPDAPADSMARTWLKRKGDAGWAGVAAAKIEEVLCCGNITDDAIYFEYTPDTPADEVLHMVAEVLLLLPEELQKRCTFNTYFIQPRIGVDVLLRCTLADNPAVQTMRRLSPQKVISLTTAEVIPDRYENSEYVHSARTGRFTQIEPTEVLPVIEPLNQDNRTILLDTVQPETAAEKIKADVQKPNIAKNIVSDADVPEKVFLWQKWLRNVIIAFAVLLILGIGFFIFKQTCESSQKIPHANDGIQTDDTEHSSEDKKNVEPVYAIKQAPVRKDTEKAKGPVDSLKEVPIPKPVVKKTQQKPVKNKEYKFKDEEAKVFFIKFNEAVYKRENTCLYSFSEPIKSINICIKKAGTVTGKTELCYPKQNPLFTLSGKGKELRIHEFAPDVFDEKWGTELRKINSILITLQTERYVIPFGIESYISEIQPEIDIKDSKYALEITESKFYSTNSHWMNYYISKPSKKEFNDTIFSRLYDLIKSYNGRLHEPEKKEKELTANKQEAYAKEKQWKGVWKELRNKEKWTQSDYEKYKQSLEAKAFIIVFCEYDKKRIKQVKKEYMDLFDNLSKRTSVPGEIYTSEAFDNLIAGNKNEYQRLKNGKETAVKKLNQGFSQILTEAKGLGLKIDFTRWKGKEIPVNSSIIMVNLLKIAKEKSKYKVKQ